MYLVFGAIQTAGAAASIGQIVSEKRQRRAERFGERLALTAADRQDGTPNAHAKALYVALETSSRSSQSWTPSKAREKS